MNLSRFRNRFPVPARFKACFFENPGKKSARLQSCLVAASLFGAITTGSAGISSVQAASDDGTKIPSFSWSFSGAFGTFDRAALQRGYQVYKQVCSACHSMKLLAYRDLQSIGLSEAAVRAIAAEVQIPDGPNDDGEMFERPGRASDRFKSPYANDKAARAANGGALPPDLSLIAKAREHGPDYLYALLTGYREPPVAVQVPAGLYYNPYFPGGKIAMPAPLAEGAVEYGDGTRATVEQLSRDVSQFLMWAAEPKLEERKRLGLKVMIYLIALSALLYVVKRKVWARLHQA